MERPSGESKKERLARLKSSWIETAKAIPAEGPGDDTEDVCMRLMAAVILSDDPEARESDSLRHFFYPSLGARITAYVEEEELWFQYRFGYIAEPYKNEDKKDFERFMNFKKHNPYVSERGRKVFLKDSHFLTQPGEANQRFGADFMVGDCGIDFIWEFVDYLLKAEYPNKTRAL
eukprot:TRINITY_DN13163_c0_g1_i1.p1 TRINITY_DN13163_c0_g1~~TRINITY_DN13163_c0_g1_i1.p1  ORF type:complete len:175 (+),score=20.29 TRINITY_DN13163_c0_g1_i1:96-620(+)